MSIQEFKNGLAEFSGQFSSHRFDGLELVELLDLLDELNSVSRNILDRIDIPVESGDKEDSEKVVVGRDVTVKEIDLGEVNLPRGEAVLAVLVNLLDYVAVQTESSKCSEGCPSGLVLLQQRDGQGRQFYLCECGFISEVGVGMLREGGTS